MNSRLVSDTLEPIQRFPPRFNLSALGSNSGVFVHNGKVEVDMECLATRPHCDAVMSSFYGLVKPQAEQPPQMVLRGWLE